MNGQTSWWKTCAVAVFMAAAAPVEAGVIHVFPAGPDDGTSPSSGLVQGIDGALYGVTASGGANSSGTLYRLANPSASSGPETVLHDFPADNHDGQQPSGDLLVGSGGVLYGTTLGGGGAAFNGTIFTFTPPTIAGGVWTETVIHRFTDDEGFAPEGLVADASGALYGITLGGGTEGLGTAFKLSPPTDAGASWTLQTLASFGGSQLGSNPRGPLVVDPAGNLFGVTSSGGLPGTTCGCGLVYELSPLAGGIWKQTVIYAFNSTTGSDPEAGLQMGPNGVLYGTVAQYYPGAAGCSGNCGGVFSLLPPSGGGAWTYQLIHAFAGPDGNSPQARLSLDAAGNLYGTTRYGGIKTDKLCGDGCGVVFKLVPPAAAGGAWTEQYFAPPDHTTGAQPTADVLPSPLGHVYGATPTFGPRRTSAGTVFKLRL